MKTKMKKYLSVLLLLIFTYGQTAMAKTYILKDQVEASSITLDGYANEIVWEKAESFTFLVQSSTPDNYFARASFLYGTGELYLYLEVAETELIYQNDSLFDGLSITFVTNTREYSANISYNGKVMSNGLSPTTAAVWNHDSAQYMLEVSIPFPEEINDGDNATIVLNISDAKDDIGTEYLADSFIPQKQVLQFGIKPLETSPPTVPNTPSVSTPSTISSEPTKETSSKKPSSSEADKKANTSSKSSTTKKSTTAAKTTGSSSTISSGTEEETIFYASQKAGSGKSSLSIASTRDLTRPIAIIAGIGIVIGAILILTKSGRKKKADQKKNDTSSKDTKASLPKEKEQSAHRDQIDSFSDKDLFNPEESPQNSRPKRQEDEIF